MTSDPDGPAAQSAVPGTELVRLIEVMDRLRRECPWDAEQTARSLVPYLIEETYEVVEAIESGDAANLREELGDLLLEVYFQARISQDDPDGGFTVDDAAHDVAEKLIRRHPHVFAGEAAPERLKDAWEQRKAVEKGRRSALDGIPDMSALARATKVIGRSRSHGVDIDLADASITADEVGTQILDLVARAQACGLDADQCTRDALRQLESRVLAAESTR